MSQFLRSRPRRLRTNDRKSFRQILAAGLSALLFLTPFSFSVNAQPTSNSKTNGGADNQKAKQKSQLDGFIIEFVNGQTVCRAADKEELPSLMAPVDASRAPFVVGPARRPFQNSVTTQNGEDITVGSGGLTIIFNSLSQLQVDPNRAQVEAAFVQAAQFWTSRIKSPVTVVIDIDYGTKRPDGSPFDDPKIIGSTGSAWVNVEYPSLLANLRGSASSPSEAALYNSLPNSALPIDTGNNIVVSVNTAVAKPLGIPVLGGSDATIAFNKAFSFDFNHGTTITPGQTDFVAVATHEIGHVLGFTSDNGEGDSAKPTTWDLFRLRPGTTSGTFTSAQRIMSIGGTQVFYTGQTYMVAGSPTTELGLSTGGPDATFNNGGDGRQSSHWKADELTGGKYIGIMDPTISAGVRLDPTENDYSTLETIGWDLVGGAPIPPAPTPPSNDNIANAQVVAGCSGSTTGTNANATRESNEPPNPDSSTAFKSVWYQWQAPSTSKVTIDTRGSGFDTVLAVYTGTSLNSQSQAIANNDDTEDPNTPERDVTSVVTFNATQGTVYLISVNGYDNDGTGGDFGNIKLNWNVDTCTPPTPTVQFSMPGYAAVEDAGNVAVGVSRTDTSAAASVDYATSDPSGLTACNQATGNASSRCDYATTVGTLRFAAGESSKTIFIPLVNDGYVEGSENFTIRLSNPAGMSLGTNSTVTITITDNDGAATNPLDPKFGTNASAFFVRQQYIDFLGREPDAAGFQGWFNLLTNCAAGDTSCDKIAVSSGFFRSAEFQDRGSFIFRFYAAALGRNPTYAEFMPDLAKVSGFLSDAQLEANKLAFVQEFMTRTEFVNRYSPSLSNTAFVDTLIQTAGLSSHPQRQPWIDVLNGGTATRAEVLRAFTESPEVAQKFSNQAFVVMQYFGYLRRDPDASYTQWIQIMNQTGDFRTMINGFISSNEYVQRFGP